jgi:AcrR family transcriptional regulator
MLLATVDVLALKGYHRATMARITRRAGLSAGAIRTRYPDKARLVAHAARSVLLTPSEMEEVFRGLAAAHPLAIAQAIWVRELLRADHRSDWRVRLDLALTARFEPTLAEFGSTTDTGPYFGLMLLGCLTEGADRLPFTVVYTDAYPD